MPAKLVAHDSAASAGISAGSRELSIRTPGLSSIRSRPRKAGSTPSSICCLIPSDWPASGQNAERPGFRSTKYSTRSCKPRRAAKSRTRPQKEIARALEKQFLNHLLQLALNREIEPQVSGYALKRITELETTWKARAGNDPAENAQTAYLLAQIEQFRRDPKALRIPKPPRIPDGSPIGTVNVA